MLTCIILHNMIVEDEGCYIVNRAREDNEPPPPSYNNGAPLEFQTLLQRFKSLRSLEAQHALRNDLIEHLCANKHQYDLLVAFMCFYFYYFLLYCSF
jgi:hypothetical protein